VTVHAPAIRVVVVEDSLLQRTHLVALLEEGGAAHVAGVAGTVDEAVSTVLRVRPDVVTMDLEIPGGQPGRPGGIVAIASILAEVTVPILVLSSHAASATDTLAIQALDAGAIDVFPKAEAWGPDAAAALRRRVGVVSRVPMVRRRPPRPTRAPGGGVVPPVVGIVASTGGPAALRAVLGGLGAVGAPILVVQHIHADFAASFAAWLGDVTGLAVTLAAEGDRPVPGHVYVAPPAVHLRLTRGGTLALSAEPDLLARPSGDELLRSLAEHAGDRAVGVVLTGMGDDGARGLLAIRERGGATIAQDAETSIVDGMPRAARESGAAAAALPLEEIAAAVVAQVTARVRA
jgi:two-component system chemotaxis response regulator CheB